jgi:hypothetical protein
MKGITNIVISIGYAVGAVKGALVKEFIGEDVTAPLPNIEASEAELPKLAEMKELYLGGGVGIESMSENAVAGEAVLMNKTKLTDDDFEMESQIDLDADLIKSLPEMKDGQKLELGGVPNPVTAEDLSNEVFGSQNAENAAPEAMGGNGSMEGKDAGAEGGGVDMEWLAKTDEEKLQWNIDQMGENSEMPNAQEAKGASEEKHDMPLERKTGRLGVGRRLAFVGEQMMKGMAMWWAQNRMVVYASLVGVLVAGGIIAFFTGGAGLVALLQLMLQAMTVIFAAEAVWRIKGHVFDWLGKAWKGDVQGGGESLAQAFAVLFSEFLFEYVLKGIGKVLKRIKKSLKATKVGRALRKARVGFKRTVKKVTKPLKGVASKGGKYTLKLRQGIAKGAKKLEDLRERILTKFGFKRMWIERAGHYIELWGEFNSKVLLARTDIEESKIVDVDSDAIRKQLDSQQILGQKVKVSNRDGIVISDAENSFSRSLDGKSGKELGDTYNDLDALSDIERRKKIAGGVSERVSLRQDIEHEVWQNALDEYFDPKAKQFIDPNTNELIPHLEPPEFFPKGHPCEGLRKPRADIGHKKEHKWSTRLAEHKSKGSTREQMIEAENNADLYHIEDRSSNRSHKHE